MTTMAEWPPILRDTIAAHYDNELGLSDINTRIGNPGTAGMHRMDCEGPEVLVDYGYIGQNALYRTTNPWPTPLPSTVRWDPGSPEVGWAAEYTVRVLSCVPIREEGGTLPDPDTWDESVERLAGYGQGVIDALAAAVPSWRQTGVGKVWFGALEPVPRSGVHAGWQVRVIAEVC